MHRISEPVYFTLRINFDLLNNDGDSALWWALDNTANNASYDEDSQAARLIRRGCSPDAINPQTGILSNF